MTEPKIVYDGDEDPDFVESRRIEYDVPGKGPKGEAQKLQRLMSSALDVKSVSGATAAILVAMIQKSEGFSIGEEDHLKAVKNAIDTIIPAFTEATIRGVMQAAQNPDE